MDNTLTVTLLMTLSLSKQSAEILFILVSEGPKSVTILARRLSISRTTLYRYLDELITKKLCKKETSAQLYTALSPQLLRTKIEERLILAQQELEYMLIKSSLKETKPDLKIEKSK